MCAPREMFVENTFSLENVCQFIDTLYRTMRLKYVPVVSVFCSPILISPCPHVPRSGDGSEGYDSVEADATDP